MERAAAIAYAREGADVAISYYPTEEADNREVIELIRLPEGMLYRFLETCVKNVTVRIWSRRPSKLLVVSTLWCRMPDVNSNATISSSLQQKTLMRRSRQISMLRFGSSERRFHIGARVHASSPRLPNKLVSQPEISTIMHRLSSNHEFREITLEAVRPESNSG